jgi:pimeloyl-ACP methyl ester carboxylesterase
MTEQQVTLFVGGVELEGTLTVPDSASGLVLFAHGSGSSRHSPRNRHVATVLNERNLSTLLFDLLTADEERIDSYDASIRFDVELLADRLIGATDSVIAQGFVGQMPIGYFGGSTGAAAALIAAARRPALVSAVVSRGGRPDLAIDYLEDVQAPTLLVVGGEDTWVLEANYSAAARMHAPKQVVVVPGATHLFEEPGALDDVARYAAAFFTHNFLRQPYAIGADRSAEL